MRRSGGEAGAAARHRLLPSNGRPACSPAISCLPLQLRDGERCADDCAGAVAGYPRGHCSQEGAQDRVCRGMLRGLRLLLSALLYLSPCPFNPPTLAQNMQIGLSYPKVGVLQGV